MYIGNINVTIHTYEIRNEAYTDRAERVNNLKLGRAVGGRPGVCRKIASESVTVISR